MSEVDAVQVEEIGVTLKNMAAPQSIGAQRTEAPNSASPEVGTLGMDGRKPG